MRKILSFLIWNLISIQFTFSQESWTGTGFALNNGYIVTNYHVIDGASTISIYGVHGDMSKSYKANVVASDAQNDLSILKISDYSFTGFGTIPYSISTKLANIGEQVFVLGYPMVQAMGNEVKLTNGIISSRTGYKGNISTYQISAPLQPGNSGGPMFNYAGHVIGITSSGIRDAENVGYAIKTNNLFNLLDNENLIGILPNNNILQGKSLAQQAASVKKFIFLIKCSGTDNSPMNSSNNVNSIYADLISQSEINFNIHNWWNANGGRAKSIDGKVIISYLGFTKVAIVYYTFKDSQRTLEYRMKILEEKCGWGQESRYYYRQYIVQNIDNPSERCLMFITNSSEPNSYQVHFYSEPYIFDISKFFIPDRGRCIFWAAE